LWQLKINPANELPVKSAGGVRWEDDDGRGQVGFRSHPELEALEIQRPAAGWSRRSIHPLSGMGLPPVPASRGGPRRDSRGHATQTLSEFGHRRQQAEHDMLALGEIEEETRLHDDIVIHEQVIGQVLIILALR